MRSRREVGPAGLCAQAAGDEHFVIADGVRAGSLLGLGLDVVDPSSHLVGRGAGRDTSALDHGDACELARVEGFDSGEADAIECGVEVVFGHQDPGDLGERLRQLDIGLGSGHESDHNPAVGRRVLPDRRPGYD
jgi:hypothetical protein